MEKSVLFLEQIFNDICRNSYPHEWDEDHVTFQLMRALRNLFGNRVIHFNGWSKMVQWQSFKNRGKQETSSGDIALLVNIQFSTGENLKGVVSIEAKRSFNNGSFASMEQPQLDRIYGNLPHSQLLLYSHRTETYPLKFPDSSSWSSHMWITPINTAKELNKQIKIEDNWKLLRTSLPFTKFLTSRVFWGLDLDFREEVYRDIVSGIDRVVDPAYLGVVNVFYEGQEPVEIALSEIWQEIKE